MRLKILDSWDGTEKKKKIFFRFVRLVIVERDRSLVPVFPLVHEEEVPQTKERLLGSLMGSVLVLFPPRPLSPTASSLVCSSSGTSTLGDSRVDLLLTGP